MKRIILLIFLVAALWLGVKITEDPGYILIAYQHWTIEMPLWLGVVFVALTFLIFYGLFRLFYHLKRTGKYWQFWSKKWRSQRAIEKTYRGFLDILNGHFKSGEKKLSHAATDSPFTLINYLSAAKAAFFQKAYARSEDYLNQALKQEPQASIAIGITKATLEVENQAWQDALNTLKPLELKSPKNPNILMLLKTVYQHLQAWQEVINLLPRLRKSPLENRDSIVQIGREAYLALLKNASMEADIWQTIPRCFQHDPEFIGCYAEKLCQANQSSHAEVVLRKYLKHEWSESLIELYGKTVTEKPAEQLRFAERFLNQHPESPQLFLCLGRLAMCTRLWGKAKYYIETSVKQAPCVEGYEILGKVLELLGDKDAAFELYRKALQWEGPLSL